jgi:hypothetical protein
MNLGMASDLDIDSKRVRGILAAVAPANAAATELEEEGI